MSGWSNLLRSLKKSTDKPVEAVVKGQIPTWLQGTLFRNGPGRFEFGNKAYTHVFDGAACVHKFKINNGQVFYSNRLLETKCYNKIISENRLLPAFGTDNLDINLFQRVKTFLNSPDTSDNVNVNVVPFGKNQLYAMTETSRICRLDPNDLKILHTSNTTDYIPSIKSVLAHPHIEADGTWWNVGMGTKDRKPCYQFLRHKGGAQGSASTSVNEQAELIATIPSSHSDGVGYFHSFAITNNYIIFLEQPLRISFKHVFNAILRNKSIATAMLVNQSFPTRIHVINKKTGEVLPQKFVADPQFSFHHINAYEINESENNLKLVVDISSYNSKHFDINNFSFENMYSGNLMETEKAKAIARRIEIPVNLNEKSTKEVLCKMTDLNSNFAFEAPTINYWRNNGQKYKYIYGVNHYRRPLSVCKMNTENPTEIIETLFSKQGENVLPSEPVFVEKPNPESEDDGVILVMVLSDSNDYLSILDAKTLKEIARADMPEDVRGSLTFHGFFADQMGSFHSLNV